MVIALEVGARNCEYGIGESESKERGHKGLEWWKYSGISHLELIGNDVGLWHSGNTT